MGDTNIFIFMTLSLAVVFTLAMVPCHLEEKPILATLVGMTAASLVAAVSMAIQWGAI